MSDKKIEKLALETLDFSEMPNKRFDREGYFQVQAFISGYKAANAPVISSAINGYLDALEFDNTADVVEKSRVIQMLNDLKKYVK